MPNVGPLELVVILAIALIVLGPKKLPEVGRSIGKGMREFKESLNGESDREGIFAGVSSGAVIHVARKLAEERDEGVVVCILPDGGWKYLSAPFWQAQDVASSMEDSLWW